jgi:hypothetical protein
MLVVRSKIYSMDFWMADKITYKNIEFQRLSPWDQFEENRKRIGREQAHYQTGTLKFSLASEVKTVNAARDSWRELVNRLHLLLPFAHGHDVPIHEMMIYETNAQVETLIAHETESMGFGKAGASSTNVYSHGLEAFLNTTMPLICDEDFNGKTNAPLALMYYNGARGNSFLEIKSIMLWMGLEAMANTFYDGNPDELRVSKRDWKAIRNFCRDYLTMTGNQATYSNLLNDISFLRQGKTKDRIDHMLTSDSYRMREYVTEVHDIYDNIRNPLLHGRIVDWRANTQRVFKLQRLMEKILFKTLNFYDNDLIHYSIKDADLSAR